MNEKLFIYGPPGSGKSTVGRKLAQALALPFYDLDDRIVIEAGKEIPAIFAEDGEANFRILERRIILETIEEPQGVVALGGGALLDPKNRAAVENAGAVICLTASFETLLSRSRAEKGTRPLLAGDITKRLENLLSERREHYASFDRILNCEDLTLDQAVWQAQIAFGRFRVRGMGDGYDVIVRNGGLANVGEFLVARKLHGSVAVVSDTNVAPNYMPRVMQSLRSANIKAQEIVIPAGERYKTIDTVHTLWRGFLQAGIERANCIVALGGGVVGDLAGFAAATYLRGVPWVVAPTSLLAMVDASMGGKTGADLPEGKNLIGAFHPPRFVIADPQTLSTLPEAELRSGMAEVVKHGVLADPTLFELCSQGWGVLQADWDSVVRRAMAVKVKVIQEDPYEKGVRATLNLGHTLGHAIEVVSKFSLKHGEAVAIGMVAAADLSERLGLAVHGLTKQISTVLENLNLPVKQPAGLDREQVLNVMRFDKKRADGQVRFVLPTRIGEVQWGIPIENLDDIFPD